MYRTINTNVLIAGSDPICCSEIRGIIQSRCPNVTIENVCSTGEELFRQLLARVPDVVISAAELSDMSCFEVVQRANIGGKSSTRFIIYGGRDFDAVYKALKYGATDYLLLPISPDSLQNALDKVISLRTFTGVENASRLFYVDDRGMDTLKKRPLSVDQINKMFGTQFVDGLFRMVFVKYDFQHSFERLNINNPMMLERTDEQIRNGFADICADIVCTKKSDGIMAVLNYDESYSLVIETRIQELYRRICRITKTSQDVDVTICVSAEVRDSCNVWQIKEQVRDVEWSRMALGTNQIIFWTQDSMLKDPEALNHLNLIYGDVKIALERLDLERFRQGLNQFYALPPGILLTQEARKLFKQILYAVFELYWDTISKFIDPTEAYEEIAYGSHLCTTFSRHRDVTVAEYIKLLRQIVEQTNKKYSFAVSEAISYVRNNVDKPITLKEVAETLHFSQGYFSCLFKKETGINFSKFVSKSKNQAACKLLSETDVSISEVAFRTGFADVRAFSKYFKSVNDITPSRYRRLHKNAADETSLQ